MEEILSSTVLLLDQAPSDLDVSYLQQFLALCFSQTGEPSSSKILEHVNSIIIKLVNSTNQTLVSKYRDSFSLENHEMGCHSMIILLIN